MAFPYGPCAHCRYTEALVDQIEETLVSAGIRLNPLFSNDKFSFDIDTGVAESEEVNADA